MKSYGEFCSVAKALDVVGDRWALLVVRELLFGPRRYTDLLEGLPGIGTNVLSTRLREFEAAGVVTRRRLPAPTAVTVYELTDEGRDLRGVVDALARWGTRRLTSPAEGEIVEPRWLVALLAATVDVAGLDEGAVFHLSVDDDDFALELQASRLSARDGAPLNPTASVAGTLRDLFAASKGSRAAARRLRRAGDRKSAERLVEAVVTSGASRRHLPR